MTNRIWKGPTMTVISRAEWGHPGPVGKAMRLPATTLWIHHSVTQARNGVATPRQIANIGISRFGRSSYSYVVTPDGTIYELQGTHVGAHTKGHNSTTLALCFAGNYESDRPTVAQIEAAGRLHRDLVARGRLYRDAPIKGHRDASGASTACPGRNLYAALPQIRQAAAATEEDEVKPEDIEAIAQRVWALEVEGKPAGNRLHDADVRSKEVREAVGEVTKGRNLARDARLLREGVRALAAKAGLTTQHKPPEEVEA